MNENFKSGFVAIIGRPNVGKSTLMNHLIGQKIAITSKKPQTTRNRIQTVYTCDEGQIVFLDTPGIHKAKNKLGEYMVQVAERTLKEVDAIMWLVEPSTFIGAGERHIAEQLQGIGVPVILIINKIDTVSKEEILPAIDTYRKVCDFAEIIPCSALRGQNTQDIIGCILKYLPYGPMFYDEDTVTDQPQRQIVAEIIREKALHALDAEIPHGIAVAIDRMKTRPGKNPIVDIDATIICERESHKGIIIGKQGAMLKKIGSNARYEIELENYAKIINIEALTMIDMAKKDMIPAVTSYVRELTDTALAKKALSDAIPTSVEEDLITSLSNKLVCFSKKTAELENAVIGASEYEGDVLAYAKYYRESVFSVMTELRAIGDAMETETAADYWPYPSYGEMLYGV